MQNAGKMRCVLTCVEHIMSGEMDVAAREALTRTYHWRVPFNWSRSQWRKEISSEVALAVIELTRGTILELQTGSARLQSIIQNRLLKRYRQEWAFGKHLGGQMVTEPTDSDRLEREDLHLRLQVSMDALSERDRVLLHQLYWEKRTATQIAAEAGVSVQAISKRRIRILRNLRCMLKNIEDGG